MVHRSPFLLIAVFILSMPVLAEDKPLPDPEWRVARAQFTTAVENREPVDQIVVLSPPADEIFFFTDLRHLQGRTVTHRWEYQGQVVSQVPFEVNGPRWRVFSKASIEAGQTGEWSVTVIDESGWPLYTELFRYEPARSDMPQAPQGFMPSE